MSISILCTGLIILFMGCGDQENNSPINSGEQEASAHQDELTEPEPNLVGADTSLVIAFSDANLEAAIRAALGKPEDTLTEDDLLFLTELNARSWNIKDLRGSEQLKNLTALDLANNQIQDISPLAELSQLELLILNNNPIKDLSPLQALTRLQMLMLDSDQVHDLAPLVALSRQGNLQLVDIRGHLPDQKDVNENLQTLQENDVEVRIQEIPLPEDLPEPEVPNNTPRLEVSANIIDVDSVPQETPIRLSNGGASQLTWTVTEYETWLQITSSQGDTGREETFSGEGPTDLTLHTAGVSFPDGVYETTIQITSNGGDLDIIVRMEVSGENSNTIPPAGKTITVDLAGGAQMEMIWILPGTFLMGSTRSDEQPQHQVTITRGYYLGKYEITQEQWETVMDTHPWRNQDWVQEAPDHPAVYVSWEDVQQFIHRLNEAAEDSLYRLPSEAEWEYATRAGSQTRWSFGDDLKELGTYAWYDGNFWTGLRGKPHARQVGTKEPNVWDLYDMHGSVAEWVQDWYQADYYSRSPRVDPPGPESGEDRVRRGGGFASDAVDTRSAHRTHLFPYYTWFGTGARLVRMP